MANLKKILVNNASIGVVHTGNVVGDPQKKWEPGSAEQYVIDEVARETSRGFKNKRTSMFKTLLQSKITSPVHSLRDTYILVGQLLDFNDALEHRNEIAIRSSKNLNLVDALTPEDLFQAYIAIGYALKQYDLIEQSDVASGEKIYKPLDKFDDGIFVRKLIRSSKSYAINPPQDVKAMMNVTKRCIKRLLYQYVQMIYDIIDAYVDDYFELLNIKNVPRKQEQYPVSYEYLKLLESIFESMDKRFEEPKTEEEHFKGLLESMGIYEHPFIIFKKPKK